MDGDWEEVKKPVKKAAPPQNMMNAPAQRGGKRGKMLVAGAVQQPRSHAGPGAVNAYAAAADYQNHASAVADYDFGVDEEEEIKFETFSHACANSVKQARMAAEMTQTGLAKKVNEKTTAIVDLENGTGRYSADLINRIERALNVKIDRGRKKTNNKSGGGRGRR